MSIPHSKVLSVSKGLGLGAEFHHNSPNSTQVVNVNIKQPTNIIEQQPKDDTVPLCEIKTIDNQIEDIINQNEQQPIDNNNSNNNNSSISQLELIIKTKDSIIAAYSQLLHIVENNPLIVNKYIVANIYDLQNIIKLLTESDSVQINTSLEVDCHCFNSLTYQAVDKIYVDKNGETLNFKYSFPDANKILDDHHISVKFVAV